MEKSTIFALRSSNFPNSFGDFEIIIRRQLKKRLETNKINSKSALQHKSPGILEGTIILRKEIQINLQSSHHSATLHHYLFLLFAFELLQHEPCIIDSTRTLRRISTLLHENLKICANFLDVFWEIRKSNTNNGDVPKFYNGEIK